MEYLFKKYKADCTVFFETGTHIGTAIQSAYDLGFELIVSIEIQERFYDYCMQRFQPLDAWKQIKLFLGRSEDNIEKLIQEWVNGRAMFWLDAHETNSPYKLEIEAIMKHERNDHVIIVDDIDKYGIDTNWIKNTLSKHNPLYTFTETKNMFSTQLIAYI
jgi:predicted O-methyltransferase YrrM